MGNSERMMVSDRGRVFFDRGGQSLLAQFGEIWQIDWNGRTSIRWMETGGDAEWCRQGWWDGGPVHKGMNRIPKAISDPFLIWKPSWFYPLWMQRSFKSGFWNAKKGVLDRDPPRKPHYEDVWTQSSFGMWFVHAHLGKCMLKPMHGSICAVGTKYYLTVRRSCSRSGRHLQYVWTHVVQITNPIRKRISERDSYLCERAWSLIGERVGGGGGGGGRRKVVSGG